MRKKWICRLCAAAAAGAMLLGAAWAEEVPELLEPAGVRLSSAAVQVQDLTNLSVYSGEVVPYTEALNFEIDGEIGEVRAVVGQLVKAGDVLLTLDQEDEQKRREDLEEEIAAMETDVAYDAAIARIDREILELELERLGAQSPRDDQAIELKKLEIEEFDLNTAMQAELSQHTLDGLRTELAVLKDESMKAEIIAPFDGRVMFIVSLHKGSKVSAYAPLIYLADDSKLHVESDYITETTLELAHRLYALVDGVCVELTPQPVDTAEILSKAVSGEKMVTRFDVSSAEGLSAGQYAAVCYERTIAEDAMVVPINSVFMGAGGRYVYVIEDGVRVRRDVKVGAYNNWAAQILEGLEEGEKVYVPD